MMIYDYFVLADCRCFHPNPQVTFSALQAHLSKLRSSARKTAKEVKHNMLKVGGPDSWGNNRQFALGFPWVYSMLYCKIYGCFWKIWKINIKSLPLKI